jgi:hypothetical protein
MVSIAARPLWTTTRAAGGSSSTPHPGITGPPRRTAVVPAVSLPRGFSDTLKPVGAGARQLDRNNPFHREYNKVITNPVHLERRLSLGTLSSEEPLGTGQWSFGGGGLGASRETINTAIVDLYQRGAGLDEPLLKTRVRVGAEFCLHGPDSTNRRRALITRPDGAG